MRQQSSTSAWFPYREPVPDVRLRLLCFPFAGGNTSTFRTWQPLLQPDIQVVAAQLPGRLERFREPAWSSALDLADALAEMAAPFLDLPYALLGISMGGLLAYEVACRLERAALPPVHLFVIGREAPQVPLRRLAVDTMDDPALIEVLRRYDGVPPDMLAEPDLMEMMLPTIRADFSVSEDYVYTPRPLLHTPVTAVRGTEDWSTQRDDVERWRDQTTGAFEMIDVGGGHFTMTTDGPVMVPIIRRRLSLTAAPPHS